jgi:hypothetical protein
LIALKDKKENMTNYKLILLIGFITLFVPFLGIPEIFRNWIVAIAAIALIAYGFYVRSLDRKENFNESEAVYAESNKKEEVEVKESLIEQGEEFEKEAMESDED